MTIPSIKVPMYEMKLPLTGEVVKYRPFLVKEEKILINAHEQGEINDLINAVGDVVSDCTDNKITVNSPIFDVQWAFLQIRGKSIGELLEFYLVCPHCDHKEAKSVDVNEFALKKQIGHTNKVNFGDGTIVEMRYPNFHHFATLFEDKSPSGVYEVVAECIHTITDSDQVFENTDQTHKEMLDWVNNLTPEQFSKLENFFITMPTLQKEIQYNCTKCGGDVHVVIDGIRNFFE